MKRIILIALLASVISLLASLVGTGVSVAQEQDANYIPGEVVVLTDSGDVRVEEVDATTLPAIKSEANAIEDDPGVEAAGPNKLYETDRQPNDPMWDWSDQLMRGWPDPAPNDPTYGGGSWFYAAHDYAKGGNLSVGVIDTGIDTTYIKSDGSGPYTADLQLEDMVARDFYTGDGSSSVYDHCNHGTSTAGTIFADTDDGSEGSGATYNVQMNIAKASGSGTSGCSLPGSAIAEALIWLSEERRAEVINMSFGGIGSDPVIEAATTRAPDLARGAGVVIEYLQHHEPCEVG